MKKILKKSSEKFLFHYLNQFSPTGREHEGQQAWLKYISPYVDETHIDDYGSAYGIINPSKDFRVVIEAHADEIAWFVKYISKDGFIHVVRNGGSDHMIAPSKRVVIHTKKGRIRGVFGWPAIHVRGGGNDAKYKTAVDKIFIDVGAKDRDEVLSMGIHVGCIVTYEDELEVMNDRYYCGRALDNRMGGFCIAEVARLLKEKKVKLPYSLYVVNAVQEEIGLRGAQMIAERIQPHCAIITDVCHDTTTPMMDTKKQGETKAGDGPTLAYAPAVHYKMLDLLIEAAEENDIPFQRQASSRSTGTDTDAFAYSNAGVPSALVSLPLKYMHTTVEMAHKSDVENVIKMMFYALQKIESGHNFKYF